MANHELEPLRPSEAVEMYLQARESELADSTLQSHRYRLNHFIRWCDDVADVSNLNELTGRDLHQYALWRRDEGNLSQASLKGQMDTLRVFVRFCERVDGVRPNLHDKVLSVTLSRDEKRRETLLKASEAKVILDYFGKFQYASFEHTLLSVLWSTGIRIGTAHGFDVSDYRPQKAVLEARHRPETDTPLKNNRDGERMIGLPSDVCGILDDWIAHTRPDVTDEYGRDPLFTTSQGRAHTTTLRNVVYRVSRPCVYSDDCPHGRDIDDCEAAEERGKVASKCPSSVSPHDVRRGSITHFLSEDVPEKVVSDRMNVSQDVLGEHYDQRTEEQKVEQRREYLSNV